jgi:sporulation protein YlmC with PRC-barrel domain
MLKLAQSSLYNKTEGWLQEEKMLFSEIASKEVLDVNANKIGILVDIDLNLPAGTVNYFILKTGVFKKVHLTPDKIDKVGQKVILNASKEAIEKAPADIQ